MSIKFYIKGTILSGTYTFSIFGLDITKELVGSVISIEAIYFNSQWNYFMYNNLG